MKNRVLVADDNPVSRELIREILEAADYEVLEAADGRDTLERIAATRPGLVLLDIQMPILDGYAVLRTLRGDPNWHALRVLALTACAMESDRERARAAGFDGFITKPIQAAELRRQVAECFARRSAATGK
jgi:CheY-like chemotaxis protein